MDEAVMMMKRRNMILHQIIPRGVDDEDVIGAMIQVPRHLFVPEDLQDYAYEDCALQTSHGQTISQPYIVALMTSMVKADKTKRALEIGTGTGYQTAILAELCSEVVTIERIEELHLSAKKRLKSLEYRNVKCILGDGYDGYTSKAPYDIILVSACPPDIPGALVDQLALGGRMAIPVGTEYQMLVLVTKELNGEISIERNIGVRFVPMVH